MHGRDPMRPADTSAIARAAYEQTARLLATPRFQESLRAVRVGGDDDDIVAA